MPDIIWRHDTSDPRIVHTVRRAVGMGEAEYHCGKVESGIERLASEPPLGQDRGCDACFRVRSSK